MEVVTRQGSFPADLQASASFQQIDPKQRPQRATQEEESRLLPQSTASFWQTQYPQIVDNGFKRPSKWFREERSHNQSLPKQSAHWLCWHAQLNQATFKTRFERLIGLLSSCQYTCSCESPIIEGKMSSSSTLGGDMSLFSGLKLRPFRVTSYVA